MTFREEILAEGVRLICGDCREILPTLGKVDAVVTDPPYGISHSSNHGASWAATSIAGDNDTTLRDEVLAPYKTVASFGSWKTPPISGAKGCLVWDKGPAFGMGNLRFPWKPSWELIYIRGDKWIGEIREEGVLRGHIQCSWESGASAKDEGRKHPHQKPVSLVRHLLLKLPGATVILDPFMGSGTTGIATIGLGRKFIGIEIELKYFDIACKRIQAALDAPDMFVEPPKPAKQEAML